MTNDVSGTATPPPSSDAPPTSRVMRRWSIGEFRIVDHLSLVASAAGVALVALRLVVVSRGNLTTAQALVQEASVSTIVLATIISFAGAVLAYLGGTAAIHYDGWMRRRLPGGPTPGAAWWLATAVSVACLLLVMYVGLFVGILVASLVVRDIFRRRKINAARAVKPRIGERLTASDRSFLLALLPLFLLPVLLGAWWPTEAVRVGRASPVRAYVVAQNQDTTVLLTGGVVRRVPTDDVTDRHYCSARPSKWTFWMYGLAQLTSRDKYPDCPSE